MKYTETMRLDELSIALQYAGRSTGHTGSDDGGAGESLTAVDFDVVVEFDYEPEVKQTFDGPWEDSDEPDPGHLDIRKVTLLDRTEFRAEGFTMNVASCYDITKYVPRLQLDAMEEELHERKQPQRKI